MVRSSRATRLLAWLAANWASLIGEENPSLWSAARNIFETAKFLDPIRMTIL